MIEATKLFRAGRRYRAFAPFENSYIPVTFTVYPLGEKKLRLRHIFPLKVKENLKSGDVLYVLVEDKNRLIAEVRVEENLEKEIRASLDFVTEDRRKLPRIKVEGLINVKANVRCGQKEAEGKVIDMSMSSVSVRVTVSTSSEVCFLDLYYGGRRAGIKGKLIRSSDNVAVFEVIEGNGELTELLSKIYTDLFLNTQRA